MSTFKDATKIARDAKKIADAIREVKEARTQRLERDDADLKRLRRTSKKLLDLLSDPPTEASQEDAKAFLDAAIKVVNAHMADPDVSDDDYKMMKLLAKRGAIRQALGLAQLQDVFDTRRLLRRDEIESITRNVEAAQQVVKDRVQRAEFVRIGFMVGNLIIKVAVATAKAMA